jgi:hypothetical protein
MLNRVSRGVIVAACVLVASGLYGRVALAEEADSNLELMEGLTSEVVVDLLARLDGARAGRGVMLKPSANTEEYRFIETVFESVLDERGTPVYRPPAGRAPASAEGRVELHFQALDFGVRYPSIFRSYLIGGKRVRRQASVTIVATMIDPTDGAVLQVEQASREERDQFSHGDLGDVEEGMPGFVRPEMPSSGWSRVVEPVFVSGIVVGLIYLFFSNQSDE